MSAVPRLRRTTRARCFHLRLVLTAWLLATPSLRAQRLPVEAERGLVVSADARASAAGVEILRAGGNAIDAAIATGFALAVTYPRAGNLGGGGFMVVRRADGRAVAIDFREVAPAAATRDLFLDETGRVVPGRSTVGYLASGVPGTVAGFALAHARHGSGRVTWAQLLEPARRLAAEGFDVTPALAADLAANAEVLRRHAASRRQFLRDDRPYAAGERFVQPDLAATLARLQQHGPQEFYEGQTAALIAADQTAHGGLITRDDLAAYRALERDVLRGAYRGHTLLTMPPPSSGGVALVQMLGMLEPHDLGALGHDSAAKIHLVVEAMRRAFRDRAEFLGDPDFHPVPVAGLTAPGYIRGLMDNFDPDRATPSASLAPGRPVDPESSETTHFSVVDAAGNVASCTTTLNGLYGNGVTVPGAGFLLNNEMDDFTAKVGVRNMFGLVQSEANAIAPGKRPLSSMTPLIVLRDERPFLVTGSPGGPTIITTVLQVLLNVVDHRMHVTQAVDAPRFHHQWQPDVLNHEPFFTSPDTVALLEQRGHRLAARKLYPSDRDALARYWGDAATILVDPTTGRLLGAADPRSPDAAAVGW